MVKRYKQRVYVVYKKSDIDGYNCAIWPRDVFIYPTRITLIWRKRRHDERKEKRGH
jgi:hypothetical protein